MVDVCAFRTAEEAELRSLFPTRCTLGWPHALPQAMGEEENSINERSNYNHLPQKDYNLDNVVV